MEPAELKALFRPGGKGVITTANAAGESNVAVYAPPRFIDGKTVAWGMLEGRTYRNVLENPQAAYLYMNPGSDYSGARIGLRLIRMEGEGELLESLRQELAGLLSPAEAARVMHVAYFEVTEVRPLI